MQIGQTMSCDPGEALEGCVVKRGGLGEGGVIGITIRCDSGDVLEKEVAKRVCFEDVAVEIVFGRMMTSLSSSSMDMTLGGSICSLGLGFLHILTGSVRSTTTVASLSFSTVKSTRLACSFSVSMFVFKGMEDEDTETDRLAVSLGLLKSNINTNITAYIQITVFFSLT